MPSKVIYKPKDTATPTEAEQVVLASTPEKERLQRVIDIYKVKNPAKYALKEKELLKKLNSL